MPERPDDGEITIVGDERTQRIVEEVTPAPPYIDPGPSFGAPGEPQVVAEDERVYVGRDGRVQHDRERVVRRPMRGPFDDFWPALAILLLAALIGLGALWYFTRDLEANVFDVPSIEPSGTVVAQHPAGGQVREGSSVRLNVSNGQMPP